LELLDWIPPESSYTWATLLFVNYPNRKSNVKRALEALPSLGGTARRRRREFKCLIFYPTSFGLIGKGEQRSGPQISSATPGDSSGTLGGREAVAVAVTVKHSATAVARALR
jgi:hypothetical protein